jgi:hypothetical protein
MGMLYKRGTIYWIKYYYDGKPVRESSHSTTETPARKLLRDREGRAELGVPLLPKVRNTTVETLLADLRAHYETTGQRNLREVDTRLLPLRRFFTGRRASAISGDVLTAYIQHRQAAADRMVR